MTVYEKTPGLRPVSAAVHKIIGDLPNGAFNFGLYFNKWFYVAKETDFADGWKKERKNTAWSCPCSDETLLRKPTGNNHYDLCESNYLLDNFEVSLALFNGDRSYQREMVKGAEGSCKVITATQSLDANWNREATKRLLSAKREQIKKYCDSLVKLGYICLEELSEAELISPMVIGLGDEHPTEKGFRFDWNLGIPFIPASSLKGVVRLAHLVNALNEKPTEIEAKEFIRSITEDRLTDAAARDLFGCGEAKKADYQEKQISRRGKVIFLDAYPAEIPKLKPEIMNCHYKDYFNENTRGPTEDQQPNPQKFWALAVGTKFIFRILIHKKIINHREALCDAFNKALEMHGIGAKTAIGHGIFNVCNSEENRQGENIHPQIKQTTPLDNFIAEIKVLKPTAMGPICSKIDQAFKILETDEQKQQFALAVRDHMGKGLKKSKAKEKLARFLDYTEGLKENAAH